MLLIKWIYTGIIRVNLSNLPGGRQVRVIRVVVLLFKQLLRKLFLYWMKYFPIRL